MQILDQGTRLTSQGTSHNTIHNYETSKRSTPCFDMMQHTLTPSGKPFDFHERLLLFACDVVRAVEFLHKRGMVGRALSNQLLSAGTSVGSNYEESDRASSSADFIAKNRIALKEAKETRFRLRVCRRTDLLDARFDPLVQESDEIVRILATIVHKGVTTPSP